MPWRLVLRAVLLTSVLAGALAPTATATVPPDPDCFYYVAGCNPTYGRPGNTQKKVLTLDAQSNAEVTLETGYIPNPPFGQPFNPSCQDPGSLGTCVYSNVAWLFSSDLGYFQSPLTILEGCAADKTGCKLRFSPRGIGNEADVWATLVAAHQIGSTTIKDRIGYAIYAPPRFRWVQVNAANAPGFRAGVAYAVRSGTKPTYASCLKFPLNATSSTSFDCVQVTGSGGGNANPSWRFALPAGSGGWTLYLNPVTRSEAGPADAPGQRWPKVSVTVTDADITETINPLPQGTLEVVIDTGGTLIQKGTSRVVTTTARVVGGQAPYDSVSWSSSMFQVKITSFTDPRLIDPFNYENIKTLLPGETSVGSATLTAPAATGSATINSAVDYSSVNRGFQVARATPVTVTATGDPVPPPVTPGGTTTVPKPPIPAAATTTGVTGRVADGPTTTYLVLWYATATCDASDPTARLVASPRVTTDKNGAADASAPFVSDVKPGEAIFGYVTLGKERSNRSECVTVPGAGSEPLAPAGPVATPAASTRPAQATITLVSTKVRRSRRATIKLKIPATGTVTLLRSGTPVAGPVPVKNGVATFKVKLTKKGRAKLTAVFTPAGGGATSTQPLSIVVR